LEGLLGGGGEGEDVGTVDTEGYAHPHVLGALEDAAGGDIAEEVGLVGGGGGGS
jgi:hypothetical protein